MSAYASLTPLELLAHRALWIPDFVVARKGNKASALLLSTAGTGFAHALAG
jgi:hypothetical protein